MLPQLSFGFPYLVLSYHIVSYLFLQKEMGGGEGRNEKKQKGKDWKNKMGGEREAEGKKCPFQKGSVKKEEKEMGTHLHYGPSFYKGIVKEEEKDNGCLIPLNGKDTGPIHWGSFEKGITLNTRCAENVNIKL